MRKKKQVGGRPTLPEHRKRVQVSITLPPELLDLFEREKSAATFHISLAQVVEVELRERYEQLGWIPRSQPKYSST